jgi:hypothetical protein
MPGLVATPRPAPVPADTPLPNAWFAFMTAVVLIQGGHVVEHVV